MVICRCNKLHFQYSLVHKHIAAYISYTQPNAIATNAISA